MTAFTVVGSSKISMASGRWTRIRKRSTECTRPFAPNPTMSRNTVTPCPRCASCSHTKVPCMRLCPSRLSPSWMSMRTIDRVVVNPPPLRCFTMRDRPQDCCTHYRSRLRAIAWTYSRILFCGMIPPAYRGASALIGAGSARSAPKAYRPWPFVSPASKASAGDVSTWCPIILAAVKGECRCGSSRNTG